MRWISLPAELAAPHLLDLSSDELSDCEALLRVRSTFEDGDLTGALGTSDKYFAVTQVGCDHYAGALVLVIRAEILRRLMRFEESLDAVRQALHWLELGVSPAAHHNATIAVYLEGVIHYALRADEKAASAFARARQMLSDRKPHWRIEINTSRIADGSNLARWMTQLLDSKAERSAEYVPMIMPVYEFANRIPIRTDVVALPPFHIMIPNRVVMQYSLPEFRPLDLDAVSYPALRPDLQYAAIRFPEDAGLAQVRTGDLMIIEVTRTGSATTKSHWLSDAYFVRRNDGRIEFRSSSTRGRTGHSGTTSGLAGIPRALIKDVEAS